MRPRSPARQARAVPLAALATLAVLLAPARPAGAWGTVGHQAIADHYGENLPPALAGLRVYDDWIVAHVMDADLRKSTDPGERYRHYIDIDAYPEYAAGTLPHDRAELEARYGAATVLARGIVPWTIGGVVDSMAVAMAAEDWERVKVLVADLCHYVGDLHQPLHCTENYDGQLTGNHGIHYRYETRMLDLYRSFILINPGAAATYPDAVDAAFEIAGASQVRVVDVLTADDAARSVAGGSTTSSTYYYELWVRTGNLTTQRLEEASVATAAMVFTAWARAGYPPVPGATVDAPALDPALTLALSVRPVPAASEVAVSFVLPLAGRVELEAFDLRGRRVATLFSGMHAAGPGTVVWRAGARAAVPAGVYFLRLEQSGTRVSARAVLTR